MHENTRKKLNMFPVLAFEIRVQVPSELRNFFVVDKIKSKKTKIWDMGDILANVGWSLECWSQAHSHTYYAYFFFIINLFIDF